MGVMRVLFTIWCFYYIDYKRYYLKIELYEFLDEKIK